MALFRHGILSKDEKIFVINCESKLLPGQAFSAQLCKFPMSIHWDIHQEIEKIRNPVAKASYNVGDMVFAMLDATYYRAEVFETDDAGCLLDFVDLGVTEKYPKSQIFPLTEELCTRWERVAIHVLLKDDMQVSVNAATVLSCIDVLEIRGVKFYHGKLSEFSEITEISQLFPMKRYVPEVPASVPSVAETPSQNSIANGHGEKSADSAKIPQPVLNETEQVFVAVPGDTTYGVQLMRFDLLKFQNDLDTFYGDAKNQKAAGNVGAGSFFVAPFGSQFCRAMVLEVNDGKVSAIYTDYGTEFEAAVSDLLLLNPGPLTDHPWGAVTIETEDKLDVEEEVALKIETSYLDPFGLPIYRAKKISTTASNTNPTSEPPKPSFPPLEFNENEQTLYLSDLEGNILAAQLGQYTVESLVSLNEKLTESIDKKPPVKSTNNFAPGDAVAVREDGETMGFYRGLVSKVEGDVVWVYQVDFGVLVKSDMNTLRPLPDEFISHPQVGIRCELSEAQKPRASEEALEVKNLRKKTHIDHIDIYEFDVAPIENGAPVADVEEQKVEQVEEEVTAVLEPKVPNAGAEVQPVISEVSVEAEASARKSAEFKDLNQNITSCDVSEFEQLESTTVDSYDPQNDVKETVESILEKTPSTGAEPTHGEVQAAAPAESNARYSPAEANFCRLQSSTPENGELGTQPDASSLGSIVANATSGTKEHKPEENSLPDPDVTYDFATVVGYPHFASVPERVHVSQISDSSIMVTLSRFDLNHLQAIDNEIKAFLDKHPNIEPTPLDVGDFVIFIRDDYCRRAEIVGKVRDEFRVACIDYGCTFVAPRSQLVRLPKTFEKYERCALDLEGSFPFRQGQEVDLILSMENGKVKASTTPSVSPPNVWNEHNYSESIRSCSVSVLSDNADEDDLKSLRDPEDPCADRSFDVVATAVHRATKVCVVKKQLLSLAKEMGETLGRRAQSLQSATLEGLEMGSVVVAKLMTDPPRFRRAKLTHYNRATELFKLFLVDSGLMVKLPLSSIFKLPADLSIDRTPGYAMILRLRADDLAYDSKIVSQIFGGTLRCSLSYSSPDDTVPGELLYEATLHNRSGNVVKQLNMKGIVTSRVDRFLPNPVMLPCTAEAEYLDAIIVSAQKIEPESFDATLLLVELKERLDRVVVDTDQLKNLYARKNGAPALAFLENDPSPWKRARVVGRPLPGKYRLRLVDVGVEITHPVLKTYKCPTNLLHIPEAAVEVTIRSQKKVAPSELLDKLVVVKTHWDVDYTSKTPVVELFDHDGNLLLP